MSRVSWPIVLPGTQLRRFLEDSMSLVQYSGIERPLWRNEEAIQKNECHLLYSADDFLGLFNISLEEFFDQYETTYKDHLFEIVLRWDIHTKEVLTPFAL